MALPFQKLSAPCFLHFVFSIPFSLNDFVLFITVLPTHTCHSFPPKFLYHVLSFFYHFVYQFFLHLISSFVCLHFLLTILSLFFLFKLSTKQLIIFISFVHFFLSFVIFCCWQWTLNMTFKSAGFFCPIN